MNEKARLWADLAQPPGAIMAAFGTVLDISVLCGGSVLFAVPAKLSGRIFEPSCQIGRRPLSGLSIG
jgi:hypothetical protein